MYTAEVSEVASVRTQIYITEEQKRLLEREAGRKKRSVAELIRSAIDLYLGQAKTQKEDALSEIVGTGSSGLKDVSDKHDLYLYGKRF